MVNIPIPQWTTVTVDNTDEMPKFFNWIIKMNKTFLAHITHSGSSALYGMNVITISNTGGVTENAQYAISVGKQDVARAWYMISCIGYI